MFCLVHKHAPHRTALESRSTRAPARARKMHAGPWKIYIYTPQVCALMALKATPVARRTLRGRRWRRIYVARRASPSAHMRFTIIALAHIRCRRSRARSFIKRFLGRRSRAVRRRRRCIYLYLSLTMCWSIWVNASGVETNVHV